MKIKETHIKTLHMKKHITNVQNNTRAHTHKNKKITK